MLTLEDSDCEIAGQMDETPGSLVFIVREAEGPDEGDGGQALADGVPLLANESSGSLTILEIKKDKDVLEDLWDTEGELRVFRWCKVGIAGVRLLLSFRG
jgi:hypothetical protein